MGTLELLVVALVVLLDIVTVRHILKNCLSKYAKYIYILLVMFLPIMGALCYYIIHYLTRSNENNSTGRQ